MKRGVVWALVGSLMGFAGFLVERHSNSAVEERVRIEAAKRCPGVWDADGGGSVVWGP
jgi:hypothetical protein